MSGLDVAVIGAGPYGLACTAHLRARGLDVHMLGQPMELWERQMPLGMFLRSSWEASSISDPRRELTLDAYEAEHAAPLARPIPLDDYLRYGRWYQRHAVPGRRPAARRGRPCASGGVPARLDDGERLGARRVVDRHRAGRVRSPSRSAGRAARVARAALRRLRRPRRLPRPPHGRHRLRPERDRARGAAARGGRRCRGDRARRPHPLAAPQRLAARARRCPAPDALPADRRRAGRPEPARGQARRLRAACRTGSASGSPIAASARPPRAGSSRARPR